MAWTSLQDLGGLSGLADPGVDDTDSSSNGVLSAFENIGENFAAGAASVGLNALAKSAGTPPVVAPYSASTLAQRPGSSLYGYQAVRPASQPFSTGTLVVGGLFVVLALGFVVVIARR